jgi:ubiquinol-cytochrome c reductase subunit 7
VTHTLISLQDTPYLTEIIEELETEMKEREDLEAMIVSKRERNAKSAAH